MPIRIQKILNIYIKIHMPEQHKHLDKQEIRHDYGITQLEWIYSNKLKYVQVQKNNSHYQIINILAFFVRRVFHHLLQP